MDSLSDILKRARAEGWAVGHFNASNLEQMRVICRVCRELKSPAIIGTSEGERSHIGLLEAVALRQALRLAPINSMSVVQHVGARAGLLRRAELERYLAEAPADYLPKAISR